MQFDIDSSSEHHELFNTARALLLNEYHLLETKKTRITTYSNEGGGICHLRTMPYGIDIGFLKGAQMEDKFEQLSGSGKVMRVLKIMSFDLMQARYYIDQAISINTKK